MRLPITTQRRDIDIKTISGQNVFELYQQIQNLLQRNYPEIKNFFAEPLVNTIRGEINWNTKATGIIKPAIEFSKDEWASAIENLKKNNTLINQFIEKLEKESSNFSISIEALRTMLMTPDLKKSLFRVGDELVLTQWGCFLFGTNANNADLYEQIERQLKTTPSLVEKNNTDTEQKIIIEPNISQNKIAPEPIAPTDQAKKTNEQSILATNTSDKYTIFTTPKKILWRWLLLLFLLLLLLVGLIWKFWHGQVGNENAIRAEILELSDALGKKIQACTAPTDNLITDQTGQPQTAQPASDFAPEAPIADDEFKTRQSENQITSNTKVNISLAWSDHSDLDLYVKQPDGQFIYFKPCSSPSCGILDVDANRCDSKTRCGNLTNRPLENISWSNPMMPGRYEIYVSLYSINRSNSDLKPIPFTVQLKQDDKLTKHTGVIQTKDISCTDRCHSALKLITEFNIR